MGIIRKLLAWLSVPIICLFALVFYAARPFNPDNNRILARVVARFGRAVLGMERPLEGWENMPQDRPTVVIANHRPGTAEIQERRVSRSGSIGRAHHHGLCSGVRR